jgi:hypothetical protein
LVLIASCEESEHFPVVVQELLLRLNLATSEFLLEEFKELLVLLDWLWLLRLVEAISGA